MPPHQKTLAFIIDQLDQVEGGYETRLRECILRQCRSRNVRLLIVAGRAFESPNSVDRVHNRIYDLISPRVVDGAILLSPSLARYGGQDALTRFVARLGPLPVCSIGLALPLIPSITVDNAAGVRALVEHLIVHHSAKTLSFIGGPSGNPEAQHRLAAFGRTLATHGLTVDPELVFAGDYTALSGWSEASRLLDSGRHCDAIVASNDAMAFGALDALRERGLRVPRDMLVTGFDNVTTARHAMPPLTTARQPLEQMGALAVDTLLALLEGEDVAEHRELPVEMAIRRSCGCGSLPRSRVAAQVSITPVSPLEHLRRYRPQLLGELRSLLPTSPATMAFLPERLLDALERELGDEREAFVEGLEDLLRELSDENDLLDVLQQTIILLRDAFSRTNMSGLENLWQAAVGAITLALARSQAAQRLTLEIAYGRVRGTGERFSAALDMESLKGALVDELPRLGIGTVSISVFDAEDPWTLRPLVSVARGQVCQIHRERFDARQLLPESLPPEAWPEASLLQPLCFEVRSLGVLLLEWRGTRTAYQMVREQISAAIRNIYLHQELLDMAAQRERSLQERVATTARIKSLSLLAGGVAHDLNNALGPLVVLPELVKQELEGGLPFPSSKCQEICADLDTIKLAASRAARTVRDLMTLGRQGNAKKTLFDINQVVAACARTEPLRFDAVRMGRVRFVVELDPEHMPVVACEAHLARAIANLLGNAVESIENEGEVVIRTFRCTLRHPLAAYESVDPGDYVVIEVADSGTGIPPGALQRVFEPFFSQKRLRESSGTGLGLSIVHGVVKEHGGFVDVESTPGEGTVFRLFFPRSAEPLPQASPARVLDRGKGRVLVVDDEPTQLRTAKRVLERYGYEVTTATGGADAVNCFEHAMSARATNPSAAESGFELVILDMSLNGDIDGLDVFERLRALVPGQRAMIVSGHAPDDRVKLAFEQGLVWLAKPYSIESLVHTVESALGKRHWSDLPVPQL